MVSRVNTASNWFKMPGKNFHHYRKYAPVPLPFGSKIIPNGGLQVGKQMRVAPYLQLFMIQKLKAGKKDRECHGQSMAIVLCLWIVIALSVMIGSCFCLDTIH